jgi:hypothetical protein
MKRRLLFSSSLGSTVGAVVGIAAGIKFDSALAAWISAAAFPVIAIVMTGAPEPRMFLKIGCYALLGWGVCFLLAPVIA